jgi:hypothetical protein
MFFEHFYVSRELVLDLVPDAGGSLVAVFSLLFILTRKQFAFTISQQRAASSHATVFKLGSHMSASFPHPINVASWR